MDKLTRSWLLHALGCLLFISIPILSSPDRDSGHLFAAAPFRHDLLSYALLLVFFYANYFYFIPKYYFRQRRPLFYGIAVFALLAVLLLPELILPRSGPFLPQPHFGPGPLPNPLMPELRAGSAFLFLLVFFLSLLLRINQRLTYIRDEKLRTEVSYLKAQINPHFLFNTLNSLYALSLAKSDDAPEAVLKLSGMMRYVVTESSNDHVPLEKEISYIRNYISLQQLRMAFNTQFSFSVEGNPQGLAISPMVLIPFIENAFKYGLNPEEDSAIAIAIRVEHGSLHLHVKNNKVTYSVAPEEESGLGMDNTQQRLEYLYPKKHTLAIKEEEDTFEVNLTLVLE